MKKGFTLAEVLITLAIIGIVAAITIPSLMADVNQKAFDNQRKTLHSRLANALTAMDRLSGYGVYDNSDPEDVKDTAAESFIVDGLSKVYKIRNICSVDKMEKCGVSESYTAINGDTKDMPKNMHEALASGSLNPPDTDAIAFETNNGESIVALYNPKCANKTVPTSTGRSIVSKMCVNFIYDLNGPKAPNMMGKDMGIITAFYKEEPIVVAPTADEKSMLETKSTSINAADACEALGSDYRLPTTEELAALALNGSRYSNITTGGGNLYWSSDITTAGGSNGGMAVSVHPIVQSHILVSTRNRTEEGNVFCVKR